MPVKLERKLKRRARKMGFVKDGLSERGRKYVYGTMRKTGWVPSTQKKRRKRKSKTYSSKAIGFARRLRKG